MRSLIGPAICRWPSAGSVNGWTGPYLKGGVPSDPWGHPYRYANPGSNGGIEILSLGADGAPGGEGENADVRNAN